jgi:murein DD-endopeptidase MepM/ murein hydrolase activator NlpD
MTKTSPEWDDPQRSAETGRFVHADLAETVERATASRFFVLRAVARVALAADARALPLQRLLRKLVDSLQRAGESDPTTTPAVLRRGLLAASASLLAAATGMGTGILPGPATDLASGGSAFGPGGAGPTGHAASAHWGRGSGHLFPTTPSPGLNVATLAPPPPGAAPSPATPTIVLPPLSPDLYVNPLARISNLQPKRIDQGVDYAGSGPLVALGTGTIRTTNEGGWPGGAFIALQLDHGLFAGQVIYYAENITPTVRVGQHVNVGDVVGILHDAFPNLEIGWGGGGRAGGTLGDTLARSNGGAVEGVSSAVGVNFNRLLVFLGAPGGIQQGLMGHLPAGVG